MSKKIKIILLAILLFVLGTGVVNASTASATLTTEKQEVVPGETFTVTFSAESEQGINGIEVIMGYDENKLEFVKSEIIDTTKWTNLGENLTAQILHVSNETVTESEIFTITFKVKESATIDATAVIKADSIVIDSEAQTNAKKEIEAQEIEVKVVNVQEPDENDGTPENDSTQEEQETQDKENTEQNQVTPDKESDKKTEENKDNTTSEKEYPKTGAERTILPIVVLIIILIASYVGYRKYREI